MSLPAREEWIEIFPLKNVSHSLGGLFPRGKSGLKSRRSPPADSGKKESLPAREEWIEMCR